MDDANYLDDPSAAARRTLAADDMAYWSAHPELPGLVAHFMAKGENPSVPYQQDMLLLCFNIVVTIIRPHAERTLNVFPWRAF